MTTENPEANDPVNEMPVEVQAVEVQAVDATDEVDPFDLVQAQVEIIEELPALPEEIQVDLSLDLANHQELNEAAVTSATVKQKTSTQGKPGTGAVDTINIPPETQDVVDKRLNATGNMQLVGTENQFSWSVILRDAVTYLPLGEAYTQRLADKDADWQQGIEYKGAEIKASAPALKPKPGTNVIEGEAAILKLATAMGVGGLVRVPLFNTGLWVYFKPATDIEFLNMNIMVAQDKTMIGRSSYGLGHSNNIVFSASRVFDFALQHVYATSVKSEELPISRLADYIKPQDLHIFIWGFLYACYPAGFRYKTPCINDPEKCQHIFEGVLHLGKLQVVDDRALTDNMKNFMLGFSSNSRSLDQMQKYQEEVTRMHQRRFKLNPGTQHEMAITLKTPSMAEWFEQGFWYINSIAESVTKAMEEDATTDARNRFMLQSSNATKLCQYVHFVEQIEFGNLDAEGGTTYVIKDNKSILESLKSLSSTDSIREKIIDEVMRYTGESTLSIIGIPAFDCPACGTAQEEPESTPYPRMASWIPLDMLQVFFGLLAQRINRIEDRR